MQTDDSLHRRDAVKAAPDKYLLAIVVVTAAFYMAMAARFLDRLDPLTGDEPFYVMTAISVVRDHDLDEANNYADRDYDEFYPSSPLPAGWDGWPAFPRTLPPHAATSSLDGLHTKHGLGLSTLIALPYEFAGRTGAVAVVLVCAVLVAANMYLLARDALAPPAWASSIAVMLAISMPIAPYAALLFPEIPAAVLLVYAVRRLASPINTPTRWALTGASIGFLPWLHQRFVPTVVVLACVMALRLWRERVVPQALHALTPIAIGGFTLIGYNFWLYDSPFQNTADHAGFNGLTGTINASMGLLLDAQWGLLIAAPVYLVAIAGIVPWWRVSAAARIAVIAVLPYLIVVASYRVWWGEWGPPARYLVPIAPFAAGSLAAVVSSVGRTARLALLALWGAGMALTLIGLMNPQRFYHQPNGVNNLYIVMDDWFGTRVATRLVAFQPFALSPVGERVIASAIGIILLTAAIFVVARADNSSTATPPSGATHVD